ncbi:hypothetical protein COJ38_01975 [Bacillus cereus]|uniref:hypothetical protein n=1 Tax=Bacillus cereus TaxID=1396 RepID=UPI000BF33610|nr:hypothetical protein [Bacillus cereus]PET48521.1 hypothetical protein CN521_20820 [Bacillus cereus]PFB47567.1 hypothetical protein CN413_02805 [Bacillus cereus]PFL94198.1 hypothetical protein COJ38_01975 [Bacillus cereus]PFN74243.1 hypothetical protein COJ64_15395 [Bacillus cereus]PFU72514.1 hypothetical protein COK94_21675 [Bacillus cereus]
MLLHKEKSEYHDQLEKVSNFIIRLLKFSIEHKTYDKNKFLIYFGQEGKWYLTKSKNANGPVLSGFFGLFKLSIKDRKRLLRVYLNDIHFQDFHELEDYKLKSFDLKLNLKTALYNFLVPFYENIFNKSGFKILEGLSHSPFSRKEFLKGYKLTNTQSIKVCSICCGEVEWIDNINSTELDHYFPKSLYPALAINANNLVPMCNTCNSKAKLGENPLNSNCKGDVKNTFIPYLHNGIDEINTSFTFGTRNLFEVQIVPKDPSAVSIEHKIENFDRIYQLSDRWAGKFEWLYDAFMENLTERYNDTLNNFDTLQQEINIEKNIAQRREKDIPFKYLNRCFFESVLNNPIMQKAVMADYTKRTQITLNSVQSTMQS